MNFKNFDSSTISSSVARVIDGSHDKDDLGYLITAFRNGHHLDYLRKLINLKGASLTDGLYILSEIGQKGSSLRDLSLSSLETPDDQARYWAFNSVLCCYSPQEISDIINERALTNDKCELLRNKAQKFLNKFAPDQFQGHNT